MKSAKGKTMEPGRFVTLKTGRVIFLPEGRRTKWADVKEKVLASQKAAAIRNKKLEADEWPDDTASQGNVRMSNMLTEAADTPETPASSWEVADTGARSDLKAQVAKELSEATGIPEKECSKFVKQWSFSSNDHDMRCLSIQEDAAREFGVELSDFTKSRIEETREIQENAARRYMEQHPEVGYELAMKSANEIHGHKFEPMMESEDQRKLLRAMYDDTQKTLATHGIEEIRIHRGVGLEDGEEWDKYYDQSVGIETNAIESWSLGRGVAADFAQRAANKTGGVGIRFSTTVPAERVLSCPVTGFGCLTEGEVVVLGGVEGDTAIVDEMWNPEYTGMSEAEIEAEMGLF